MKNSHALRVGRSVQRDRPTGWEGARNIPKEEREGRHGQQDHALPGCAGGGGRRREEAAGSAERAGAGSGLVKAARRGEIAARIAELHKTPPAQPAAAPAPISSLIGARAGYAFKCYLIGLRRSWGPECPRLRPARAARLFFRVTDCHAPPPAQSFASDASLPPS